MIDQKSVCQNRLNRKNRERDDENGVGKRTYQPICKTWAIRSYKSRRPYVEKADFDRRNKCRNEYVHDIIQNGRLRHKTTGELRSWRIFGSARTERHGFPARSGRRK